MACIEEPLLIAKIPGHVRKREKWTGSAAPKPADVSIGREMSTLTVQPCIGLIQPGGCELHDDIMMDNGITWSG
jgi:hypothetical protein